MLILTCPCCGVTAEETEFHQGGEAHLTRHGPGSSDDDFHSYLFAKENPRGVHFERWRHVYGCGKWFIAARDTLTLEIYGHLPRTDAPAARPHPRRDHRQTPRLGMAGLRMTLHLAKNTRMPRPPRAKGVST